MQYAGEIPASLGQLGNLQELQVSWNQLTGHFLFFAFISIYSRANPMHEPRRCVGRTHLLEGGELFIFSAEFVFARSPAGLIPAELANLAALEFLGLAGNKLSGESHSTFLSECQNPSLY